MGNVYEVVFWDCIVIWVDIRDIRVVGRELLKSNRKKGRGNVRVEDGKNKYIWRNFLGIFK